MVRSKLNAYQQIPKTKVFQKGGCVDLVSRLTIHQWWSRRQEEFVVYNLLRFDIEGYRVYCLVVEISGLRRVVAPKSVLHSLWWSLVSSHCQVATLGTNA